MGLGVGRGAECVWSVSKAWDVCNAMRGGAPNVTGPPLHTTPQHVAATRDHARQHAPSHTPCGTPLPRPQTLSSSPPWLPTFQARARRGLWGT